MQRAVFAVHYDKETNTVAATTRPEDILHNLGLPGGKVDLGETNIDALFREAKEEGWELFGTPTVFHTQMVEHFMVTWYLIPEVKQLSDYKEKPRGITPIRANIYDVIKSGYGNGCLSKLL